MPRAPSNADDPGEVSPLLRSFRIAAGLTQEGLAERAGLGVRSIQGFELGERPVPVATRPGDWSRPSGWWVPTERASRPRPGRSRYDRLRRPSLIA